MLSIAVPVGSLLSCNKKGKSLSPSVSCSREWRAENASIRIENPEAPKKGWLVKFSIGSNSYYEFFADKDYGSKEKSFAEVRRYVEKQSNAK